MRLDPDEILTLKALGVLMLAVALLVWATRGG